jgi:hypothetical protein
MKYASRRSRLVAVLLTAIACATIVWARRQLVVGRQVHNWASVQIYAQFLEAYRASHGDYPRELTMAIPEHVANRDALLLTLDSYAHPLHYESDGHHYLLASFGRDGLRDTHGYVRHSNTTDIDRAPCYKSTVDTAYSSDGVRQLCGK